MFKVLAVIFFCAMNSSALLADEKGPAVPDYPLDKVAENIYVIHGPISVPNPENQGFINNPGIVLTSKGAVIVDPGGTVQAGEMVLRVLQTVTDKPVVAVFNTHVHGDHWLGNQAVHEKYPDVKIYAHPKLIERVANGAGEDWLAIMHNTTDGKSSGTRVVAASHAINHSDVIQIGDTSFQIHHYGVAHTDTDIMIAVNENSVLFTGDNLLNGRLARTTEGHLKGAIESCEKVSAIDPVIIVPGHGQTGGMAMFNHSLDLFRLLYKTVKQLYDEGMNDYEMKPRVLEVLLDYRDWEEFDNNVGRTINQAYLEIEAEAF